MIMRRYRRNDKIRYRSRDDDESNDNSHRIMIIFVIS